MSRKVGIMSMQRIFNYGSSLQGYALRRLIESVEPSAQVRFVDYRPGPTLVKATDNRRGLQRVLAKLREYGDVRTSLKNKLRFFNHKRSYAKRYFPMIGISPMIDRDLQLDLQVIGSDEVFNCVQSNVNVGYSLDLFGRGSAARRVASYAGSFGNTTLEKLQSAGVADTVADDLSKLYAVSVRDRNSATIVESLTGREPAIHLDPTLVYDFTADGSRIPAGRQRADKYVIIYGYSGRISEEENDAVRSYADNIGAQVLAFGGLQSSADEFIDCDPFTLLAYFRDAEAVVSDTFHGTIFSIINEVPFATVIRRSEGGSYGNEEKLGYLLETLGMTDRALHSVDELEEVLAQPIDWVAVRERRDQERYRTLDYLRELIREGNRS